MTRKDFELIAEVLRESKANDGVIQAFADALRYTNPAFDKKRFVGACKEGESK